MPLELRPTHKLTYKFKLTPQMRLGINLLQMPLLKLRDYIKEEIEKNPLLDIENEGRPPKRRETTEEDYKYDVPATPPNLQEHLLNQLYLITDSDNERKIGEFIIGNINDDGYLTCLIEEVTESANTVVSEAEKVLSLIQTFDPVGVGARGLKECLLLQLKAMGKEKFLPAGRQALAWKIVDKYLPFLKNKRYKYIAGKLKISVNKVKETIEEIARLEAKPGRSFNTERTVNLIPDAVLKKNKGHYEVVFNDGELPRLTLNAKYKRMIKQKDTPEDAKAYLKKRLEAARTLIDAVRRRKETIRKVTEEIIAVQKDFLDNGTANFKPMTLEQIAKKIGKHKSTVSRALANKYLQTPYGIVELRYFLNSGVKQENGGFFSSKAIKSRIKELTEKWDKESSLTDQKIVQCLQQEGISISRRTVAKYRTQLKILSSKSRRLSSP